MSFTITIKNIPDRDLGPVLARMNLPKSVDYDLNHADDGPKEAAKTPKGRAPKTKRMKPETRLTMTGRSPVKKGTPLDLGLKMFERFEGEEGIGSVTVANFRDHLKQHGQPLSYLTRLVHENYLKYLDDAA